MDFGLLLGTHLDTFSALVGILFCFRSVYVDFCCVFFGASKKGAKKLLKVVQKGVFFEVLDMAQVL